MTDPTNVEVTQAHEDEPAWQGCCIPPEGWWCSREEGHTGPCAARPVVAPVEDPVPLSDDDKARIDAAWEKHKAAGPAARLTPPVQDAGEVERINEAWGNLTTHRDAWINALKLVRLSSEDDGGTGYWSHELRALTRTLDVLAALPAPATGDKS